MREEIKYNNSTINGVIKKSLVIAVLQNKPSIFYYHLLANKIETTFPNKLNFYKFFTHMLEYAYQEAKGKLHLKIESPEWEEEGYTHYCFYDNYHMHSRIYIKIKESNEKLCFDMLPF